MAEKNFSDIGRIAAIESLFEGTPYKAFETHESESDTKVSCCNRLFLEGIDFDLVYFPLKHLGYKSVVAVTGELYAQMCTPKSLEVKIGVSSKLDLAQIRELWQGIVSACVEHAYAKLLLDLQPSCNGLAISVCSLGESVNGGFHQNSASGDLICISGSLGGAFFGQQVLEREKKNYNHDGLQPNLEKYKMFVASYLKPEIRPNLPRQMKESNLTPSMGLLVDRGLADALKRIVRATSLGAKVYAEKIPFEGNSFELGKEMNIDPISAAMNGGDDYRVLYTVPILQFEKFRHDFQTFDIIGHLARPEVGAVLVTPPDGVELPVSAPGWPE